MRNGARSEERRARRQALPRWRRLLPGWRLLFGTLLCLLLAGIGGFVVLYLLVPVPDANARAVAQSNVYYYADGTELARTGAVNREDVPLDRIPLDTQHAVVSAEDRTFYRNKGIDLKGITRAALNTLTGKGLQGGSTITQQYVKNYYLTQDQTLSRKGREVLIALKVDQQETKDDILDGYLNTSYFGRNAYGIQTAAHAYYGVDAERLTLPQGAYLAALLQAPSLYDVKTATPANREKAVARWNYVLDGMVTLGFLDQPTRAGLTFPEPLDPRPAKGLAGQTGYLVDLADNYLTSTGILDSATLKAGGWKITTSFDKHRQDALARAVRHELTDELDPAARPNSDTDVRVAAASVDVATGRLVAAYGGADYATQPYNDALRQDNQIGSTFKPIDLAAGLQYARSTQDGRPITTRTGYDGTSGRTVIGGPTPYAPPNEDGTDYGNISLRYAMVRSVNSVYAQEGVDAGLDNVRDTAVRLGIPANVQGMDPGHTSMTLGTATPSAVNLAGVYAAFAAHGQAITPWAVLKLEKPGASEIPPLPSHTATTAVSRGTADAVTDVLRDVTGPHGTGAAAQDLDRPAAGKTGTTDSNLSAWFAGYTPELATAVGLFRENPVTHAKEPLTGTAGYSHVFGGTFPTRIWTTYMAAALDGTPVHRFELQPTPGNEQPTAPAGPSPTPSTTPTPEPSPSASASPEPTPSAAPTHSASAEPSPSPSASPTPSGPAPSTSPATPRPSPSGTPSP